MLSLDQPLPPSLLAMRLDWDVFLSFRGEDTRHNFTGKLKDALDERGIRTFIDNEGLSSGDVIAPSLVEAIHDSAAAVAVISENYADSRWCLEELVRLFECRKLVIPVFYRVNPSHVRRQNGKFGDAFRALAQGYGDECVERWKQALEMVGNRSGFVLDSER